MDCEDLDHLPIISLGPEMVAVSGVDQLRGDPQFLPGSADAAFENPIDVELSSNLLDVEVPYRETGMKTFVRPRASQGAAPGRESILQLIHR